MNRQNTNNRRSEERSDSVSHNLRFGLCCQFSQVPILSVSKTSSD